MLFRRLIPAFFLLSTTAYAAPIGSQQRMERPRSRIIARQDQAAITEPVSFQTVTTTETQAGVITETCQVTLTPIEGDLVREDKSCSFTVVRAGATPPDNNDGGNDGGDNPGDDQNPGGGDGNENPGNGDGQQENPDGGEQENPNDGEQENPGDGDGQDGEDGQGDGDNNGGENGEGDGGAGGGGNGESSSEPPASSSSTESAPTDSSTTASDSSSAANPSPTDAPAPAPGDATIPADSTLQLTQVGGDENTSAAPDPAATPVETTLVSTLPDGSETTIISSAAPAATSNLTTFVTTLSDGVATTIVSAIATAAEAQQGDNTPGRRLEVLPIGLGVFAGISVIALIVVGLVTYERTKYRKAFRQRKLAEAGASMGYGGMAERT